ncbi:response regulator transcription factor [Rhizobium leguminosarum]|uniref:response regulator transcription factor n=1 Tax=Rhizobium leguminosarum TaxID=384 RepID=UPI003CFFF7C5
MPRLLIVADDLTQGNTIYTICKARGFAVDRVETRADVEDMLRSNPFECIVLDVMLADGAGEDILLSIRKRSDPTPIVILSEQTSARERARLLNAGADDFLSKPYDPDELFARIYNATRRQSLSPLPQINIRTLVVRPAERLVECHGERIGLSSREWAVFECLLNRRGHLVTRDRIETAVYDFGSDVESNTVEVYISRLRKKIGRDLIETTRGFGYSLVAE